MGLLSWVTNKPQTKPTAYAGKEPSKVKVAEQRLAPPEEVVATTPWARNIVSYARKVSQDLQHAQVPTWLDKGFWVISADVAEATWHVPVTNRWTRERGYFREGQTFGTALILFTNGSPANAEFYGHFNFDEEGRSYTLLNANVDSWGRNTWGSNNFASWRDGPGAFGRVANAGHQEGFVGKWNHRWADERPLGLGTSLALKRFLESHRTQLPRYYG